MCCCVEIRVSVLRKTLETNSDSSSLKLTLYNSIFTCNAQVIAKLMGMLRKI